ncbi:CubicO group peptidase (beta-lactamase class C family) [Stackebrandtia endophytica]|uniref:CubicO group peptidase (Beta-lactamase class C family) n=2 Tax=Stackebrandtia endophytica TaxID=1496996 RepID=A0A543AZU4_9ACTN|nr:CubicO group peptidase (beta-lactamase class C family) [Stackebrandtia endophytica]
MSGPVESMSMRPAAAGPMTVAAQRFAALSTGEFTPPAGVAVAVRGTGPDELDLAMVAGNRSATDPMTVRTRHDLASVTKIVAITTSLIRLVSDGVVALDDPVARYLPGFTGDGRESVTLEHLLRHRGGLWEWQPLYLSAADDPWGYIERLPLRYRPGTQRRYSDLGFMLLGRVVETACGEGLAEAVTRLVIEPLGLGDTSFARPTSGEVAVSAHGDDAERRMVATGVPYPILTDAEFTGWRREPIVGEVNDGNAFRVFGGVSGHAGLFGSIGDLLTFGATLARYRDHVGLWRPEVVERFLAPGPDAGQSLGFRSWTVAGSTFYGHPGFVGCTVGFSPDAGLVTALCANRLLTDGTPMSNDDLRSVADAAAAAVMTERDTTTPTQGR